MHNPGNPGPGSIFQASTRIRANADRNYRKLEDSEKHIIAATQSILSLHFAVHDSTFMTRSRRRELRRIVTKMIAVSRALCLATVGPHPSDQSASYNLNPLNYIAVVPAYSIINEASERSVAMCRVSELNHGFFGLKFGARKSHFLNKTDFVIYSDFLRNLKTIQKKKEWLLIRIEESPFLG